MKSILSGAGSLRRALLDRTNRDALDSVASMTTGLMQSYIVVTPTLVHLAPLATQNAPKSVRPVLLANGLVESEISWLRERCNSIPLVRLRTSLRANPESMFEHGTVIDLIARSTTANFCVQDADCFVTDAAFWEEMTLNSELEYAAGPFVRGSAAGKPAFPETFLLLINAALLRHYMSEFGITAATTDHPNHRAQTRLAAAGYPEGVFIDALKEYYDTLQQYWVIAKDDGFEFKRVPGEDELVYHIGGTSYLHHDFSSLEHWDYWPLSVQYLHLRLLSMKSCERLRARFDKLFEFHGSSEELLEKYPRFAGGWRRARTDELLIQLKAEEILS